MTESRPALRPSREPTDEFVTGHEPLCGADVTLRDDQHRLAVCCKAASHIDAHEDKLQGVTWTDEHHA